MPRNIFVLGLDEVNLATLRQLPDADRYDFHRLLTIEHLQHGDTIPIGELLEEAEAHLRAFDGRVDAVVGYWDFPVSSMVPILSRRLGLRSASLEAVLKCEHKYWSRLEQQQVISEHPRFALVDLDSDEPQHPGVPYPLWLKPVKSFSSDLAFKVADDAELRRAAGRIRDGIGRIGEPFGEVLSMVEAPAEVAAAGGMSCLAEEAVSGRQVTIEGFRLDGDTVVYGAVDSISYPGTTSFLRFQYPSMVPERVLERMDALSRRVVDHIGLDASTFNVEWFWDPESDELHLLEVNPRHSQSHAHLFADVDGMANHECMVRLALGERPELPHRQGPHHVAAKWFWRHFSDGVVTRAPTDEEVAAVEELVPGVTIDLVAQQGQQLSEMRDQDSYSYKLANLYIGAESTRELVDTYERCVAALWYEIDGVRITDP